MKKKEIAIISDIHGNSWAFREVLADIKSKGIQTIINLGDSLYGPLDSKGTFELLVENKVISISGNEDRIILENLSSKSDLITLEYVKAQIDKNTVDWLEKNPFDLIHDNDIYCCHASPMSDLTYLLESLQPDYVAIRDNSEIDKLLKDIKQKIVVCGHNRLASL